MKRSLLIILIIVLIALVLGLFFFLGKYPIGNNKYNSGSNNQNSIVNTSLVNSPPAPSTPKIYTIKITSSGFSPKSLTINQGDTVTFVNDDLISHWPASAMHPTHTVYPGSDIRKCGTSEGENIFDACKGLSKEESFTFTFNEQGSWGYHDHFNPSLTGRIIAQ